MIDKDISDMSHEEYCLYNELQAELKINQDLKDVIKTNTIEDILDKEFKLVHYGVKTKSFGYKNNA